MTIVPRQKSRLILATLLVLATGVVGGFLLTSRAAQPAPELPPTVLVGEADGFRYEYHVPTGHESLYDISADPRFVTNVLSSHQETAAKCRRALAEKMQVQDLDALRSRYDAEIRRLRALGYL